MKTGNRNCDQFLAYNNIEGSQSTLSRHVARLGYYWMSGMSDRTNIYSEMLDNRFDKYEWHSCINAVGEVSSMMMQCHKYNFRITFLHLFTSAGRRCLINHQFVSLWMVAYFNVSDLLSCKTVAVFELNKTGQWPRGVRGSIQPRFRNNLHMCPFPYQYAYFKHLVL